jgi:siroheme synthase
MQLSQIPTLVPLPFANSGTKNVIPVPSQIGITAGAASLTDGFPPLTFTPLSAGGVPPSGADFNGILNLLSANTQWENAGGFYTYNASFSSSIGGYPKNALLAQASGQGYWLSLVDNNTTDPDTGGAGWVAFSPAAIQAGAYTTGNDTGSANAYAVTLSPPPAALTPGMMVSIDNISGTNTGASTLNVNGMGALPIQGPAGATLQGGEMAVGYGALLRLNHAGTAFTLLATTGGSLPVKAATASNQAVNLGQLQAGSIAPTFGATVVSPATAANQAVTYSQLGNLNGVVSAPVIESNTTLPNTAYGQAMQVPSGVTVTLPTSNGNDGDLLYFYGAGGNYSITNNSGQFIYAPPLGMTATSGTTTLTVPNGGTAVLISRGSGEFDLIAGSVNITNNTDPLPVVSATASNEAVNLGQLTNGSLSPTFGATVVANATAANQAVALGQFLSSLGTNGYLKLPNGLIVQWGQVTPTAANTLQLFSFSIPFPTAALGFVCSSYNNGVGSWANGYAASTSQFGVSSSAVLNVSYVAIGH